MGITDKLVNRQKRDFVLKLERNRSHRLARSRTFASQASNMGSNPIGTTE